ncbi:hypothetical protein EOI86_21850 [Hwanghaeella grinnelliae]|uniref:Uncharacterized protein n=1 Tax=Hwanghaeella grinnelliae TaxID=2500179 RepID=A0A3S2VK71_9PROT|nr:hypothetical protein [Hwanghaeella grinnelliae]RVU33788.1 hypothetical protein EOI86_21850 [Hwanghaeella grinnelliae]
MSVRTDTILREKTLPEQADAVSIVVPFFNEARDVDGFFRPLGRHVVDARAGLPERQQFMDGLFAWLGHRTVAANYGRTGRPDHLMQTINGKKGDARSTAQATPVGQDQ